MRSALRRSPDKNELLCFLQQKSSVLKFDDLVTITAGFYSADEIKGALACITEASGQRIPTYKGGDKDRKTVVDILKIVLNPEVTLPTYVAVNISRLPPVDVDHIDMSALLRELSLLRAEVQSVGLILRAEMDDMKVSMRVLQEQQLSGCSSQQTRENRNDDGNSNKPDITTESGTFASKARDLNHTGMKKRAPRKHVLGSSKTKWTCQER